MDRDIQDLQSEFQTERFDYLETIRRQEQQLRLLHQIIVKVQPLIRKDSNYRFTFSFASFFEQNNIGICNINSDLDNIKQQCVWVDEFQRWKLPEVTLMRIKLPPTSKPIKTQRTMHFYLLAIIFLLTDLNNSSSYDQYEITIEGDEDEVPNADRLLQVYNFVNGCFPKQ